MHLMAQKFQHCILCTDELMDSRLYRYLMNGLGWSLRDGSWVWSDTEKPHANVQELESNQMGSQGLGCCCNLNVCVMAI